MNFCKCCLLILFFLQIPLVAQEVTPWSFRFGFGTLFPKASAVVGANSPNGLNISAGMAYRYRNYLILQGVIHLDYFTEDRYVDFRSYVLLISTSAEIKIHILNESNWFSPYLIGSVAPTFYRNTRPYIENDNEWDPNSSARISDINGGYTLKYGLGLSILIYRSMRLWTDWQKCRFDFFTRNQPIYFRSITIGLLLDVEWIL
jgi:hypothetical protein